MEILNSERRSMCDVNLGARVLWEKKGYTKKEQCYSSKKKL